MPRRHEEQLHEQQLLNVVTDLCRFILHEVVHVRGILFTLNMNLQLTKNTKVFVSGTLCTSVPAPVALIGGIGHKHVFYTYFDDVL
jgi:hypothetical protein